MTAPSVSKQATDLLQKASSKDFARIKENIDLVIEHPDSGNETGTACFKHVCAHAPWIIEYRCNASDRSLPKGKLFIERISYYARM